MSRAIILQLCHSYEAPFLDVAKQTVRLFSGSQFDVITVYIIGKYNESVAVRTGGLRVIFMENSSKDIKGLKRAQVKYIRRLHQHYGFRFAIAHRYKAIYIATQVRDMFTFGVNHAFGVYRRFSRRLYVSRKQKQLLLLGVSDAVRDDIRASLPRIREDRIQTLYNRVNVRAMLAGLFERKDARKKLDLSHEAYVFANVGRLHPDKDQQTLISAFTRVMDEMPDAKLVIIGKGRLEQSLKEQVQTAGAKERVLFLGRVEDAWRYFSAFDSFLLSSDYEPFGMVLLEAMVAGVPIATTNCGGAAEVVGQLGMLFPLGDVNSLVFCMRALYALDDKEKKMLREKMLRRVMTKFSDQAVHESFFSLADVKRITADKDQAVWGEVVHERPVSGSERTADNSGSPL